jgi:hypothetical protein
VRTLPIVWQRLVDSEGQTCPRCAGTREALEEAFAALEQSLPPLGIKPTLETREIDNAAFEQDPSQSNRIWIADKPLEDWLGALSSSSSCCSVCGDTECRTIEFGNESFEIVPAELILRAALLAAAQVVGQSEIDKEFCL